VNNLEKYIINLHIVRNAALFGFKNDKIQNSKFWYGLICSDKKVETLKKKHNKQFSNMYLNNSTMIGCQIKLVPTLMIKSEIDG